MPLTKTLMDRNIYCYQNDREIHHPGSAKNAILIYQLESHDDGQKVAWQLFSVVYCGSTVQAFFKPDVAIKNARAELALLAKRAPRYTDEPDFFVKEKQNYERLIEACQNFETIVLENKIATVENKDKLEYIIMNPRKADWAPVEELTRIITKTGFEPQVQWVSGNMDNHFVLESFYRYEQAVKHLAIKTEVFEPIQATT